MRSVDHKEKADRLAAYARIKKSYNIDFHDFSKRVGNLVLCPAIFTIHGKYGPIFCGMGIFDEQNRCSPISQLALDVIVGVSPEREAFHLLQFSAKHTGNVKLMKARLDWFDSSTRNAHRNCLIMVRNRSIYDKIASLLGLSEAMVKVMHPQEFAAIQPPAGSP